MSSEVPGIEVVRALAGDVARAGGRALLVGGCVRDPLLGLPQKDLDLEVFGVAPDALEKLVAGHFAVLDVGKSFGVLKARGLPIDVSLPRRETKVARGHRGFAVDADPHLPLEEAARRRDLTVNALYQDPLTGEILDPLHGLRDLRQRRLRHCSERFPEDPLRVLRVMQFAARFQFAVDPELLAVCRGVDLQELPRERVEGEWRKLLLQGVRPSLGLRFLADCGALHVFPEIDALRGVEQNPEWHPEGDVFVHTGHVLDHFAAERRGEPEDWVVGLALLCHDLGKALTTRRIGGVWRSPGHSEAGEAPTRSFLARLTGEHDVVEQVVALVLYHLRPFELWRAGASDTALRRLAHRVDLRLLVRVARHDHGGRPPLPFDGFPAGTWLLEQARRLEIEHQRPRPLLLGRHLLARGLTPGPHLGVLLQRCFEAQLDGAFHDLEGGLRYLDQLLGGPESPGAA